MVFINRKLLFDKENIVKVFLWKTYTDIPVDNLIVFVDADLISDEDEKIFQSWERHFQGRCWCSQRPYIITVQKNRKLLWVEDWKFVKKKGGNDEEESSATIGFGSCRN